VPTTEEPQEFSESLEGMVSDVSGWAFVGQEVVNGVPCKHYRGSSQMTVPDEEQGTVTVETEGDVWVADKPGLPAVTVRMIMDMKGMFNPMPVPGAAPPASMEQAVTHLELDLHDINAAFTIEPPQ
jgi:hypothetical protein